MWTLKYQLFFIHQILYLEWSGIKTNNQGISNHGIYSARQISPCLLYGRISITCLIPVFRNNRKYNDIFTFSQKIFNKTMIRYPHFSVPYYPRDLCVKWLAITQFRTLTQETTTTPRRCLRFIRVPVVRNIPTFTPCQVPAMVQNCTNKNPESSAVRQQTSNILNIIPWNGECFRENMGWYLHSLIFLNIQFEEHFSVIWVTRDCTAP